MGRPTALALAALLTAALGCNDDTESPAEPVAPPNAETASVTAALSFRQVSAGGIHSCAVTGDDKAYCWGDSFYGQTGTGVIFFDEKTPKAVLGPI